MRPWKQTPCRKYTLNIMSSESRQQRYHWLREDRSPWKLLRADNAPLILSFIGDLFESNPEIPMNRARAELEIVLKADPARVGDVVIAARHYLNEWIDEGYLREQNQQLSVTAITQTALQFADSLGRREMTATASHLETVNEEMRRLLITLSPDVEERQRLLDEQISALEAAKARLRAGEIPERSPAQKREHARHVYNLAIALTQDFRYLEDEMRRHELSIHQHILDEEQNRGSVLGNVLDAEDLMRQSQAGQAFDGFYSLLGDEDRSIAFRGQIRRLIALGISEYLDADESRYLIDLVSELLKQSERVINRRRAAIESLRAYILSGAREENRAVDRLLKQAAQLAIRIKEIRAADWRGWNVPIPVSLTTGKVHLSTPTAISVTMPEDRIEEGEIVEHAASKRLKADVLGQFSGLRLFDVAFKTRHLLRTMGSRTIQEIAAIEPITGGVEELLALIRIAKATAAISFGDDAFHQFEITDAQKRRLRVKIPALLLVPENFPEDLSELNP